VNGKVFNAGFMAKKVETDEYFGGCAHCGKTDGYVNYGRDHWFVCDAHRVRWYAGSNLFSSWREDKTDDDIAREWKTREFTVVDPVRAKPEALT